MESTGKLSEEHSWIECSYSLDIQQFTLMISHEHEPDDNGPFVGTKNAWLLEDNLLNGRNKAQCPHCRHISYMNIAEPTGIPQINGVCIMIYHTA
jgi:hypothetical protein